MTSATRSAFGLGVGSALALPAWIVAFSFLGVGSLAREAGHPLGAAIFSTVLVWAAPAQLILYGSLAQDGLVAAAALAVALSAIRLMPMTLALLPLVSEPRPGYLKQALVAHLVAATTWIDAMRRLPELEPPARLPYFLGFALSCLVLSVGMTAVGFLLLEALPRALAAALLCLTPIYFTVALVASARVRADWLAIAFGLGLAPLAALTVGKNFDLLATGVVGGTAAYLLSRATGRTA